MHRTTIMLPINLKNEALALANQMHLSLGELIRQSLEEKLNKKRGARPYDPFFDKPPCFKGKAPKNASLQHDDYLYGEEI